MNPYQERLVTLQLQHKQLETQLMQETQRLSPDDGLIMRIKRQKLKIKDEIEQLTRSINS